MKATQTDIWTDIHTDARKLLIKQNYPLRSFPSPESGAQTLRWRQSSVISTSFPPKPPANSIQKASTEEDLRFLKVLSYIHFYYFNSIICWCFCELLGIESKSQKVLFQGSEKIFWLLSHIC